MAKKHFQAIADVVRESDRFASQAKRAGFAAEMAAMLTDENPRFDRVRFLTACQPRWTVGTVDERAWDKVKRGETIR